MVTISVVKLIFAQLPPGFEEFFLPPHKSAYPQIQTPCLSASVVIQFFTGD